MKCNQARDMLLDRLDGSARFQPNPDLDLHLGECPACQTWYKQQKAAAAALEQLEPYRVPPGFSTQVLAHLPQRKPIRPTSSEGRTSVLAMLRQAWDDLASNLISPVGRRRLTPVFVTAAAVLVIAVCFVALVQGVGVPVTPGAAAGSSQGWILAGGIVVVALVVIGLILIRRK